MPSIFNVLVCILALLVGVLIGEKYRKWKKNRDEKKDRDSKKKEDRGSSLSSYLFRFKDLLNLRGFSALLRLSLFRLSALL